VPNLISASWSQPRWSVIVFRGRTRHTPQFSIQPATFFAAPFPLLNALRVPVHPLPPCCPCRRDHHSHLRPASIYRRPARREGRKSMFGAGRVQPGRGRLPTMPLRLPDPAATFFFPRVSSALVASSEALTYLPENCRQKGGYIGLRTACRGTYFLNQTRGRPAVCLWDRIAKLPVQCLRPNYPPGGKSQRGPPEIPGIGLRRLIALLCFIRPVPRIPPLGRCAQASYQHINQHDRPAGRPHGDRHTGQPPFWPFLLPRAELCVAFYCAGGRTLPPAPTAY